MRSLHRFTDASTIWMNHTEALMNQSGALKSAQMKYSTDPDQQGLCRGAGSRLTYMFKGISPNLATTIKKSQLTRC